MPYIPKILGFAGSTREGSFNKKLVKVALDAAHKASADVTFLDLADIPMPLFDEDLERKEGIPENAKKFKKLLIEHDGIIISSPEYNSSISGVLKNAIDWATRPIPNEAPYACFAGKIFALISASPGALGGLRGLTVVRSLLSNIRVIVLPEQIAIARAHEAFDMDGKLKDPKQQESIEILSRDMVGILKKLKA